MSEINKQVNKKLFLQITITNEQIGYANHPFPGWRPCKLKDVSENFHSEKKNQKRKTYLSSPPLDFPFF